MSEPQKCNFFPQESYYIPGYAGFYPQVGFQVGKTYGRTTSELLNDPEIPRSSCSVLAPLTKPKFIEDFSQRRTPAYEMMDQYQTYIPRYSGSVPYQGLLPDLEPRPAVPRAGPRPGSQSQPNAVSAQLVEQRKYSPCHPGIRLSCGPGWRQFAASAGTQLVSEQGDRKMICHPDIPLVCGQEAAQGPCHADIALSCGQGWRSAPFLTGTDQPTRIEAVPLPPATETADVSRFGRTPKLDMPNLIQRKAISGYMGFIPRFTWIMGVSYPKGVKDAMDEFDCNQEKLRSPLYSFGKRLPHTYWPNTKIYNSQGLISYSGFVPSKSATNTPSQVIKTQPSSETSPIIPFGKDVTLRLQKAKGKVRLGHHSNGKAGTTSHLQRKIMVKRTKSRPAAIRHNYGLTFGNSTRKAYYDELLRRQQAA